MKANPLWTFEGLAFNATAPVAEACPADRVPVIRLYNNGMGGQASHRFLTSHSEMAAMLGGGWMIEGAVFCAIPSKGAVFGGDVRCDRWRACTSRARR